MRRIDVIAIGIGVLVVGAIAYQLLQTGGMDSLQAGIWAQFILVCGLLGWLVTYFFRVTSKKMTYNQQLKDYEEKMLEKKFAELSPEELAKLQAEVLAEREEKGE
jgi:membrane protein implicated in regulation of membrane protease activity